MARQATNVPKLPRKHFSNITWIGLAALTIAIALFVGWAVWFPSYPILSR